MDDAAAVHDPIAGRRHCPCEWCDLSRRADIRETARRLMARIRLTESGEHSIVAANDNSLDVTVSTGARRAS